MSARDSLGAGLPIYRRLSPRARQRVHLAAGGLLLLSVALVFSAFVGEPHSNAPAAADLPKPRSLGAPAGSQLDPRDAWMGSAGKQIAEVQAALRDQQTELAKLRAELAGAREGVKLDLDADRARRTSENEALRLSQALRAQAATAQAPAGVPSPQPQGQPPSNSDASASGQAPFPPVNAPLRFPGPPRVPAIYPPGVPNAFGGAPAGIAGAANATGTAKPGSLSGMPGDTTLQPTPTPTPTPALVRLSVGTAGVPATAAPAPSADGNGSPGGKTNASATASAAGGSQKRGRTLGAYLPVGYMHAVLIAGLHAPTGGQAQNNPVNVLLRVTDLAQLPNGFRAQVRDCLIVAEGYGNEVAERAYIRTTLLSCVTHDGRVLEVPLRGSVFGEDGMSGMAGRYITKQGTILYNAWLAGMASGIGSGVAIASQPTTATALGTVTSSPTDAAGILRQGLGTGASRALDRIAQYYIGLAERSAGVVEVQPGRFVDVAITEGAWLDVPLAAIGDGTPRPTRGSRPDADRSALMRTLHAP